MPFPFNGRDYVVKYDIERSKNKWMLTYASVIHPSAPIRKHTRLPNAAGMWELKKIGSNDHLYIVNEIYGHNLKLLIVAQVSLDSDK